MESRGIREVYQRIEDGTGSHKDMLLQRKHLALKKLLDSARRERESHRNILAKLNSETQTKEQGVPSIVYQLLYLLQVKKVQRARSHQAKHGTFFQASYSQWKKKLRDSLRMAIHNYKKAKVADETPGSDPTDQAIQYAQSKGS